YSEHLFRTPLLRNVTIGIVAHGCIVTTKLEPAPMLSPQALQWLRCPIDPNRNATLIDAETHLTCSHCQVRFRIRDGFPNLIADEAELPDGCPSRKQLPCQQSATPR